jgi:ribosome-associated protein
MTSLQLSRLVADAAAEKKARDIVRIDIRQRTTIADYFVICEGDTDRQVRAISDAITDACEARGIRPFHVSGYADGSWVVLDYSAVIVHIFLPGERAYYDLEALWRSPAMRQVRSRRSAKEPVPATTRARKRATGR